MSVSTFPTRQAGINFPGGAEWGAINQVEARRLARDPEVRPRALRVFFAAIGWANRINHAEFAPGGLAMILQDVNPQTGELSVPSAQAVNKAVVAAKDMGIIHADSGARCLLLPHYLWQKNGKGSASCGYHGQGKAGAA